MRLDGLSLALLLAACTVSSENAGSNAPTNAAPDAPSNAAGSADNGAAPAAPAPPTAPDAAQSGFTLSAAPASATAGATMTLTLRNGSRGEAGYNLCTSGLETAAGVPVASDRVCTMELRTLAPGGRATYAYELPVRLAPGSYRFVTNIERLDARTSAVVRSNSFQVR